ncbi:MAG: chromosome segregation protein SMC [Chloroflexota bacterium]
MKLKRLTLQGYKTFASKTEFVFDQGLTAIVGPNGSGKSNVADAVRWVLGEQSYSTLRGKRTVDMIFSGSKSRPRAGMAQAVLTLDNSNGWLPIDYNEVEIGRRAYRSGENEYLLNGQKVRLKDITELLATSGLSQRTYTIIGQGLIDRALSLKADERRALFEEAAGINHYKSRRSETLRRLQETQRNLMRVHDILAEIRPRLNSLKRQATRAQNYEQVTADLHNLLQIWYGFRWEQAKEDLRIARETAASTEKTWQETRRQLLVHQQNASDLQRRIAKLQQRLTDLQEERDDVRDNLEASRREVAILQERQKSVQRQLSDMESEIPPLEIQFSKAESELNESLVALAEAQATLNTQQSQLTEFNSGFQSQQVKINEWQKKQETAVSSQQQAQNKLAQAEGQLNQLKERLDEQKASSNLTESDQITKVKTEVTNLTAVLEKSETAVKEARTARRQLTDERQALIKELKQLRRAHRDDERQLRKAQSQFARLEARVEMLDQMRLKEVQISDETKLLGNFASLIEIPEAHKMAVSAALKEKLAALIFTDEASLKTFSQSDNPGQVAIAADRLPEPVTHPVPEGSGVIGWASSVVKASKEVQRINQALLGQVLLVKDSNTAYQVGTTLPAGCFAVSPDGMIAAADGSLTTRPDGQENDILARESRWREAQDEVATKAETLKTLESNLAKQQDEIQAKQDRVDAMQQDESKKNRNEQTLNQTVSKDQRALDRAKQQLSFLERQEKQRLDVVNRLTTRISEVEQLIETQKTAVSDSEAVVLESRTQLAALPVAEATQQRETLQQAIHSAQTIVAGRQAVVDSRRATMSQLETQLTRLNARQATLQQQLNSTVETDTQDKLQALQDKLSTLDAQLGPLRSQLQENRVELVEFEEKTAVLQKSTHDKETTYTQTKITYTQRKSEIESLQDRIKTDLGIVALDYGEGQIGATPLPIGGVQTLPKVTELPADIEETIQNYRGQIQRMGAINPDAPEEYQETLDRFEFLNQQIEDLNQTEAQLRKIIDELDDLTSRAFAETVEKVNNVFGETFTQLFGGGAGRLQLTDPDDLTISGVDIIARLPNRREQELGLLSGGERSLTAAALIFSLLKVSPTPFCIMDEVDAALDEANINRFRDLLKSLTSQTQFIVITHNRGTVQAAETIYGISMGTDSASQAISIKPEDYVKQPELL